jgi:hypothetical protein
MDRRRFLRNMLGAAATAAVGGDALRAPFVAGSLYGGPGARVHLPDNGLRVTPGYRVPDEIPAARALTGLVVAQWVWKDGKIFLVVHNHTDEPIDLIASVTGNAPIGEPMRFEEPPDDEQLHLDVMSMFGEVLPTTRIEWGSFRA